MMSEFLFNVTDITLNIIWFIHQDIVCPDEMDNDITLNLPSVNTC